MATNFIGVLLPNSPDYTVESGFSTVLYDADGGQTIIVKAGASLDLMGALGANTIKLAGNAAGWQVYRDGSNLIAVGANGSHVEVPANTTTQTIAFADVSLGLRIDTSGQSPAVMLGSQVLATVAAPVGGAPPSGSTQQAPWTLIMPTGSGIFASDGTEAGSHALLDTGSSLTGRLVIANAGQTAAVLPAEALYGTDGTAAGTTTLAAVNVAGQAYYKMGNKIVITDGGGTYMSGVVTDGTKAGTVVLADLPADLVDPVSQTVWGSFQSGPYGRELFRTVVTDSGASTGLVKDIQPGTGNGMGYYWNSAGMAMLPNGKVVFGADDGTGPEPWISDGTAAGTVKLADFNKSFSGSSPARFLAFGDKVAFVATADDTGSELFVTDGTPDGTKAFDLSPGQASTYLALLGTVNGVLYFTADIYPNYYNSTHTLFSTDGVTARELAKLSADTAVLGLVGGKVFLRATDVEHGQELWVFNPADGTTQLVKDILPGSGSALAAISPSNVAAVGNLLGFMAYTSPSVQAYFLSDGTAAGTWQISKETPRQTVVLGQDIFFADTEGVHMVNASGQLSLLAGPKSPPASYYGPLPLQFDQDQVFFLSGNNALYSAGHAGAVLLADSGVTQFKVVGENGVYFIKTMPDGNQSLWFSDGAAAGTRFVETLPAGTYDLSDAAGLHTPGVPTPGDNRAPLYSFAKVVGNQLTLAYSDDSPLDASHIPAAGAFHVSGTSATVTGVVVDAQARTVVLTLSQQVKSTDVVRVSYTDPTTGNDDAALQDSLGNDAATIADQPVANLTPDNVAPVLSAAVVDGATLTLNYTDASPLDGAHLPPIGAFKLQGTAATITGVSLDPLGHKLVLTLSAPVLSSDTIKVSYTDPSSGNDAAAVQDLAGNDAASVTGFAVDNKTVGKAPWTLLITGYGGLYTSDGTTAGSKYLYSNSTQSMYGQQVAANADHSAALYIGVYYNSAKGVSERVVLGIDGTGTGAVRLLDGTGSYSSAPIVFGHTFVVPNSSDTGTSAFVTDGTVAGTHTIDKLNAGYVDVVHQNMWSPLASAPYGTELMLTHVDASGAATSMVKDINPGTASGYLPGTAALMSNGKFVFAGNDDAGGVEPWVSDGTEAGTLRLADLVPDSGSSYPTNFTAFGSLVAFSAFAYQKGDPTKPLGQELVVTDGTVAGTHVFDVNPGSVGSSPYPIGTIGASLYFTADMVGAKGATKGLFSTDGASVKQVAEIGYTASLLGNTGTRLFFSISDADHGAELWATDSSGGFGMVKDILPGSGSALSGSVAPVVVGSKLVFQAYTSATTQSMFVSDGTADGTVAISGAMSRSKAVGNVLVYSDAGTVYGVDVSAASPKSATLVTGTPGSLPMQADADQVFFALANGDLYVTNGSAGGTVALAHAVKAFKVVAENALYFIEQVSGGTGYELGYSDGTAAGTYLIGYVDSDLVYNFDSAIGIKTVGVPPAQH